MSPHGPIELVAALLVAGVVGWLLWTERKERALFAQLEARSGKPLVRQRASRRRQIAAMVCIGLVFLVVDGTVRSWEDYTRWQTGLALDPVEIRCGETHLTLHNADVTPRDVWVFNGRTEQFTIDGWALPRSSVAFQTPHVHLEPGATVQVRALPDLIAPIGETVRFTVRANGYEQNRSCPMAVFQLPLNLGAP